MRGGKIEQLASPQDIYLRPANEFVADFIGDVTSWMAIMFPRAVA